METGYWDVGRLGGEDGRCKCVFCGALFWPGERLAASTLENPRISRCCDNGAVKFDLPNELLPDPIHDIIYTNTPDARHAREKLRSYNNMCSMVSCGIKDVCPTGAPGNIRVHGQIFHRSGPIGPPPGVTPKYMQIYCVDTTLTDSTTEQILSRLDTDLLSDLRGMLRAYNPYVQLGMNAAAGGVGLDDDGQPFDLAPGTDLHMVFKHDVGPDFDRRTLGTPARGEVGMIIAGDITKDSRDIVISRNVAPGRNVLRHIDDLNPHYLPMAYPLLFPYGFFGWHLGMRAFKGMVPRKLTPLDYARYLFQVGAVIIFRGKGGGYSLFDFLEMGF